MNTDLPPGPQTDTTLTARPALRLHGLDAVRGFAALSVVIFHWQFWGRSAPSAGPSLIESLGNTFFNFFYQCGVSAVGLFFVLSGFVFYWLFRDAIETKRLDGRAFVVDRFSRLYPLFFATLLWTWAGHNLYAWMNQGPSWNPGANNFNGFLQQLLVVPLWFTSRVVGFNLPSWTLPLEALMYTIFFLTARLRVLHLVGTSVLLLLAGAANLLAPDISYAMTSFFMGGLCYLAWEQIPGVKLERPLRILLAVSWPLALVFGAGVINLATTRLAFLDHYYAIYILYPATVLYLAVLERRTGPVAPRWSWFGDATYSMYLLHYPLMLTTAIVFRAAGWNFELLRSPLALTVFVFIVVLLSVFCYRLFERPTQNWIRRRFLSRPRSARGE